MNLEEIMELCEKYMKIDETKLGDEALKTPRIYGHVLRIRTNEMFKLKTLEYQYKKLYNKKRDYYLGRAEPEEYKKKPFDLKVLKSEVDSYIEADDEVQELAIKIELQQEKINYMDNALKQIANRGFAIKNAIDFQKLMNGGF